MHFLLFFTTWSMIIVFFHKYLASSFDIIFITFMTMMIGMYMSFVKPKKFSFVLGDRKIVINGLEKFFSVDLTFHVAFFLFIFVRYRNVPTNYHKILNALLVFLFYFILIDIKRIYGITYIEVFQLFTGIFVIYLLLLAKFK